MIIQCQSCSRKFVVKDRDIPAEGRMVQCGYCSVTWHQIPVSEQTRNVKKIKTSETVAFNIFGKGLLEAASTSSKQLLRFYTQTKLWMRISSLKASAKYLQCTKKLTEN